ncbi:MAG: hypothetical protein KBC64_00890, partial [Simkaniaceae bacterium]|nr:hypothetical protein [Simkaniaceae bacterium]
MGLNKGLGELGALGGYFSKRWEREDDHCRKMVSIGCSAIYVNKNNHREHRVHRDPHLISYLKSFMF